ncbi:MAG: TonB family protein [Saprospiraceae bacterium]
MTLFLLKLTLCWGFFALLYALLLRQETFFRLNRLYLLGTAALGIALAALPPLSPSTGEAVALLPAVSIGLQQADAAAQQWKFVDSLWAVYWLGVAATAARTGWGISRLVGMAVRGRSQQLPDGCLLIENHESAVPFSFFKWVFVPQTSLPAEARTPSPEAMAGKSAKAGNARLLAAEVLPAAVKTLAGEKEGQTSNALMLAHERAHAQGWHSADVLLTELLCIALWFHPLAHWYRRTLRTVHEFLADEAASRHTDKKQYGLLLIRQAQSGPALALAHHFFQSPLKQRLIMLMKQHSAPVRALKYGLLLPMAALFVLLFQQNSMLAQTPEDKPKELFDIDMAPQFVGGQDAMMKYLGSNIQYPEAAKKENAQATLALGFVIEKDGSLSNVENLTATVRPDLVAEAIRVVKAMPKWTPGMDDGKPVRVKFTLPIRFKLN